MKIIEIFEQIGPAAGVGTVQPAAAASTDGTNTVTQTPLDVKSQADILKQKTAQRKNIQDQIAALTKQINDLRMQQNSIK